MSTEDSMFMGIHYEYPFGGMAKRTEWLPQGPEDYKRDLAKIRDTGFDCIRIRIGLDSGLDDVAVLLDLCQEEGISVLFGFATFYVHNDFIAEFPDSKSVDRNGETYPLHVHDYRWQRCCISHPEYRKRRNELLAACARRFDRHPAVKDWDVHNEPHLGPGDFLCYNPYTVEIFRQYCRAEFPTIASFNQRFEQSFDDHQNVEPPREPDEEPTGYWRFWREFMSKVLTDFLMEGVQIISDNITDSSAKASFNFTNPFNPQRTGQDWWVTPQLGYASTSLYRGSDETTASSAGVSLSLLKALAKEKETWVTEAQGGPFRKDILWRGMQLEAEINQVFSHAIDALFIYRWDPLMAGAEPWINGMVDVDNYDTEKRLRTREVIASLKPYQELIRNGHNVKPRIGILLSRESLWTSALQNADLSAITTGLYGLFLDLGFEVTFLTEPMTADCPLAVVCVPNISALDPEEWGSLDSYMRNGGRVIAELPLHDRSRTLASTELIGIKVEEWMQPIYFIAGWSMDQRDGQFGGFAFHERIRVSQHPGEAFARYRDTGESALMQMGPEGRMLMPTFPLGRTYASSLHQSVRKTLRRWLPIDLEPDVEIAGVPLAYRPLVEARIVEHGENALLFVINRSGYAYEVEVTPRGYSSEKMVLPHHGAMHRLLGAA